MNNDLERFSEERLKEMQRGVIAYLANGERSVLLSNEDTLSLISIALTAKQAKPVGYFRKMPNDSYYQLSKSTVGMDQIPLYTTPQPAHPEQVPDMLGFDPALAGSEATVITNYFTPDGWKLVPIEMTDDIGEAIAKHARCCGGIALDIYDAALAAAPKPESE